MARVELVISDEDQERFVHQARREGMSLDAWLLDAARERIEAGRSVMRLESPEDLWALFHGCNEMDEIDEPDLSPR
ncbi:MAG: hypothetical protein OYI31_01425 [Chloroflexota bacterium]|nr:hypothetical protein [Chloroflexota bacterium]MDE2942009.1 hypothetical protein [Chloroflexota bacterium]MDE3267107.1 hypothetical protein [Chloroflexota bacterium]